MRERIGLKSLKVRIFLTCWILYSVHFATNVVREHYPAFSLAEHGTFKVDDYLGFNSTIFLHKDGHSYVNNNVASSLIAALPLIIFDPALDLLEDYSKQKLQQSDESSEAVYRTEKPNRRMFFKLVKKNGLELRFGGATLVTSVFLMAPLSSLFVLFMFQILIARGVTWKRAVWITFLFGFGTPVFFRTAHLTNNMFVMYTSFWAFYLLWMQANINSTFSLKTRIAAGFLSGSALAFDYSGLVPLLAIYGYLVFSRTSTTSLVKAFQQSLPFILGAVPPVLFLLYSQWAMYGNPFLPGQYWMPDVNYTDQGWRGLNWPSIEVFLLNLFHPEYGMYTFAPLLIVGLIPTYFYSQNQLILPRFERRGVAIYIIVFLLFCASNQYSRMQFNTGFRYLLPIVPFIFLAACDHLNQMSRKWLIILSVPVVLHSWVLSMVRESVPISWNHFLKEGFQLPWLTVLRLTNPENHPILSNPFLPELILIFSGFLIFGIWKFGISYEAKSVS